MFLLRSHEGAMTLPADIFCIQSAMTIQPDLIVLWYLGIGSGVALGAGRE